MPTTVKLVADNIFPAGSLIDPTKVTVIYAGRPDLAVWRDPGKPIITTAAEMSQHVGALGLGDGQTTAFGREALTGKWNQPFWNSNDVQQAEIRFRVDGPHGADRDGDGKDLDTLVFRFADLADTDKTGADLWFNGVHRHIDFQANGSIDVFAVRTDADFITLKWDSGTDKNPDGFAMMAPCIQAVDPHHDAILL